MPQPLLRPIIRPTTPSEYARCLLDVLGDHPNDHIKIDVILLLFAMFDGHAVENAVLYNSDEVHGLGALRMDDARSVYTFLDNVNSEIIYAAFIKGEFHIYQYPYYSRSKDRWVFLPATSSLDLPANEEEVP